VKEFQALKRMFELDEVSAVFIFRNDGKVMGYSAPPNYKESTLNQVSLFLLQPVQQILKSGLEPRDLRISFESFSVWIKSFSEEYYLAVFIQTGADFNLLRQPINLAALNLGKTMVRQTQYTPESEAAVQLTVAAHHAEMELLSTHGQDSNSVFERIVILGEFFFGPVSMELFQHGLHKEHVQLPLDSRADLEKLAAFTAKLITNVEHQKVYLEQFSDLMDRLELEFAGLARGVGGRD